MFCNIKLLPNSTVLIFDLTMMYTHFFAKHLHVNYINSQWSNISHVCICVTQDKSFSRYIPLGAFGGPEKDLLLFDSTVTITVGEVSATSSTHEQCSNISALLVGGYVDMFASFCNTSLWWSHHHKDVALTPTSVSCKVCIEVLPKKIWHVHHCQQVG